jgi:oligopeptide transport system substrate-binding protein
MKKFFRMASALVLISFVLAACGSPATPTATAPTSAPAENQPAPTAVVEQPTQAPAVEAAPTQPEVAAQPKAIVAQMMTNDPKSIDPQQAVDARDSLLEMQMFPPLILLDVTTNTMKPGVAKSWDVSADGKVYTFHLLEKVPWVHVNKDTGKVEAVNDESGNPRYVTANDFVYGFIRALDPQTASPAAYILSPYIVGGDAFNAKKGTADQVGVKAVDANTFQITAPEKVGYALGIYGIINARATPEWAIKSAGDHWTDPDSINTYGPFTLKSWEHEASMVMVKNPLWPGTDGVGQAKLDQVTFRFIDDVTGLQEFEAGTLDFTLVPGGQIQRVSVDAALSSQLKVIPGTCTQAWGFNTTKAPFNNAHIRRAFNFAVDRDTLVNDVLGGGQVPAVFFTPPSVAVAPSATDAAKGLKVFDADKAKAELELGLKDLKLTAASQLPPITVEFGNNNQELSSVAQAMQTMWKDTLGVSVQLSQIDNTTYWSKQEKDAGQIFRAGWCPDYNDTNNYLRDVYRSDSIYNYGKWTNADFDKLVDEARVETDVAKRLQLYTQAEQLLNIDDAGTMVLYYPVRAQVTRSTIARTYYGPDSVEWFWTWDIAK